MTLLFRLTCTQHRRLIWQTWLTVEELARSFDAAELGRLEDGPIRKGGLVYDLADVREQDA